jgi:predicted amidohydrolase
MMSAVRILLLQPALPADGTPPMQPIRALLEAAPPLSRDDLVLLPEHVRHDGSRAGYLDDMRQLARDLGAHVVGGSFHEHRDGGAVNAGAVVSPGGDVLCDYDKLRPYAGERERVVPGQRLGEVDIAGRRLLMTICADFWFSDLVASARALPDVILVPAFSVSRKPSPDYAKSLWRHMAIARAYEHGVYVAISDWAHTMGGVPTSGVAGFADPTTSDPAALFASIGDDALSLIEPDFDALERFRQDRIARGFFWKRVDPT